MSHLHCIALRTVRVSDNTSILTAWSQESGRVSIRVAAGDSRDARRRRALMMPLSMFEGVTPQIKQREIITLRDVRPSFVNIGITTNPVKSIIAIFLADALSHLLHESQRDDAMWAFLSSSIEYFDKITNPTAIANFHLYFLIALSQMLGIKPDESEYRKGWVFDIKEGRFTPSAPLHRHFLEGEDAMMTALLMRINRRNLHLWQFNRGTRGIILNKILEYYTLHHTRLTDLTSLSIVRDISL